MGHLDVGHTFLEGGGVPLTGLGGRGLGGGGRCFLHILSSSYNNMNSYELFVDFFLCILLMRIGGPRRLH